MLEKLRLLYHMGILNNMGEYCPCGTTLNTVLAGLNELGLDLTPT